MNAEVTLGGDSESSDNPGILSNCGMIVGVTESECRLEVEETPADVLVRLHSDKVTVFFINSNINKAL